MQERRFPGAGDLASILGRVRYRPWWTRYGGGFDRQELPADETADERWARCDIKSTALLPNVLAKTKAREAGAYEAWLVDSEGYVGLKFHFVASAGRPGLAEWLETYSIVHC